jgi:hypothetical protein
MEGHNKVWGYSNVFEKLKQLNRGGGGGNWSAQCPAHEDKMSSLSLKVADDDGRLLVKCHAGCSFGEIIQSLGLPANAFFSHEGGSVKMVESKTYDYKNAEGELLYQSVRREPKDFRQRRPDGNGGWVWNLADTERVLYRYPELLEADEKRVVFVVEGEKDVESLRQLGLLATCNPGGAGKWRDSYTGALKGRRVVVIPDNDEAGVKHAEEVANSLRSNDGEIRVMQLPGLAEKGDVTDWIQGGGSKERLQELFGELDIWTGQPLSVLNAPRRAADGPLTNPGASNGELSGKAAEGRREAERVLQGVRKILERSERMEDDPWAVVYMALGIMEEIRNGKEII